MPNGFELFLRTPFSGGPHPFYTAHTRLRCNVENSRSGSFGELMLFVM